MKDPLKCSFCGKDENKVKKLVAGPRVYICDECVEVAVRLMQEDAAALPRPAKRWWQRWLRFSQADGLKIE